ncbi:MAG: hypothetical protein GY811_08355 [Myxococcales bacterium]|nr:hypothetical protein [Myxococcales bacterium]
MNKTIARTTLAASLAGLLLTGCGDNASSLVCGSGTSDVDGVCTPDTDVTCGEGTYEVGGECSPFDPDDDQPPVTALEPSATVFREAVVDVRLVTEPGARIFYTTDGSEPGTDSANELENVLIPAIALGPVTLRFYALDGVGNQEETQTVTLAQDLEAPSAVTNLVLTEETDDTVTLSWDNPTDADFAGVVVMREGLRVLLLGGTAVNAGDVVYVGTGTTVNEYPGEGYFNYRVVPFDALNNYGLPVLAAFDRPPVLVGSTGWSLMDDGNVVAGSTPSGVDISITHDVGTTFDVSATNNTLVTYHSPKLVFTNIVDGTWGDGTVEGDTFARLGTNGISLAPGETLTGSIVVNFTGAPNGGGVSTATTDLAFRNDPTVVVGEPFNGTTALMLVDHGTFEQTGSMSPDLHFPIGNSNGYNGMKGVVSRLGSRFLWAGNRSKGSVRKIDMATWTTVATADIGEDRNLVGQPVFGPGGLLWVALSTSGPGYLGSSSGDNNTENYFVGIDPDSMTEARRILVSSGGRLRGIRPVPGTSRVVITNHRGGELYIIDLAKDDSSALTTITDENITPSRTVALSADGATAYLAAQNGRYHDGNRGDVSIINLATEAVTLLADQITHWVQSSGVDPAGMVWFGDSENVTIMDPADNGVTPLATIDARATLVSGGLVYVMDGNSLLEVDPTNQSVLRTGSLSNSTNGHLLELIR